MVRLDRYVDALRRGEVVALPTDTVYGLAALASNHAACRRVFALKQRPGGIALPVLVGEIDQALAPAAEEAAPRLARVAHRFWPGPLTIVVPRRAGLGLELGGDERSIGLRCPAEPSAREICRRAGPIATTSANRHGASPCRSAAEVRAVFGDLLEFVLDAGWRDGQPSSVVSLVHEPPVLLRAGPVVLDAVVEVLDVAQPEPHGAALGSAPARLEGEAPPRERDRAEPPEANDEEIVPRPG